MNDSELLKSFVDEYQLEANGVKFWAPYFINLRELSPNPAMFFPGPFVGKGSPQQLQVWASEHAKTHPELKSTEGWRAELIKSGVGIDCSGFIYHVLDSYLRAKKLGELWDFLYVAKKELLDVPDDKLPNGISRKAIDNYPEQLSLHEFCQRWGKDPSRRTNVRRLVSGLSTVEVPSVKDLQPGDMVDLRGPDGDHIGVILGHDGSTIEYADSIGLDLQGVTKYTITLTDHEAHLKAQNWNNHSWYADRYDFVSMRRLKVLDD